MICAWDKLISILPIKLRDEVNKYGSDRLQELRLRVDSPPVLCMGEEKRKISGIVKQEDMEYIVNAASRYSPWTAGTAAKGYLTAGGGHRIGLCGDTVLKNGVVTGFRKITAVNIRVARDFPGISRKITDLTGSILMIGPPGSGKTTLLRDLIRRIAERANVSVVDERGELFPGDCFSTGSGLDILSGCPKSQGIEMLLRAMGPEWIAVDEITASEDCDALVQAGWCGVKVLATAHAYDLGDLRNRSVYRPITESGLFSAVCVLCPDKTYRIERLHL